MPAGSVLRMSPIFLRTWYEGLRHRRRRRRVLQRDEHQRLAGLRVAAHPVDVGHLLQLALDPVGDLLLDLARRRAGPAGAHDHHLERERRILRLAELPVRERAGERADDDQVEHERAMVQRPLGQVEARVGRARGGTMLMIRMLRAARRVSFPRPPLRRRPLRRTGFAARAPPSYGRTLCPGWSLCTPAVTTHSPPASPAVTTTPSSRNWPIGHGAQRDLLRRGS